MSLSRYSKLVAVVVASAAVVVGCRAKPPATPVGTTPSASSGRSPGAVLRPPKMKASVIATVGDRAIGPFLARSETGLLAALLAFGDDGVRRVSVVPLTPKGEMKSGMKALVPTPFDSTDLAVTATRGPDRGYAVSFSALTERGKGLWAFGVTDDGVLRAPAAEITRSTNDIVWTELVPSPRGALLLWVEQSVEGEGSLLAASLDPLGKLRGVPVRVLRGVSGWQVVPTDGDVQLAVVQSRVAEKVDKLADPNKKPDKGAPAVPAVSLYTLDADARITRAVAIAATANVKGTLEVARDRGRTHVAWTDASSAETEVLAATIDDTRGLVAPPHPAADTRDGTTLLGLSTGTHGQGTAVVWERDVAEAQGKRFVHVARLGEGPPKRVTRVEVAPKSRLELASSPEGFALLASLRPCAFEPKVGPECAAKPFVPSLLRTDSELQPLDIAPLEFGEDPPGFGWALGCDVGCVTLSASAETPSHVRSVFVPPRSPEAQRTAQVMPPTPAIEATRFLDVETLATGEAVAHLAHVRMGDRTLVATLSSDLDVPGNKARAATLRIRSYDDQGKTLDEPATKAKDPTLLTNRALAVGGVAIAAAGKPEDGGAVAWVAREGGDPEVHVTRIDARGRRTNDVVLTNARGDAQDVALAWVGNGFIVGWVDTRNGNGEVYTTKIGLDLKRIVREERITNAPGDATGLRLVPAGRDRVLAVWSDPREAAREGFADIYVCPVRSHDATKMAEETRLLPSLPHSRSPEIVPWGDGAMVVWIEEAPDGADPSRDGAYRALAQRIDAMGKPVGPAVTVPAAGPGYPTSIAVEPMGQGFRGVLARASGEGVTIDGFVGNFGAFRAFPVGSIATPRTSDVALLTFGEWLYFGEDGASPQERRLRRGRVSFGGARP